MPFQDRKKTKVENASGRGTGQGGQAGGRSDAEAIMTPVLFVRYVFGLLLRFNTGDFVVLVSTILP